MVSVCLWKKIKKKIDSNLVGVLWSAFSRNIRQAAQKKQELIISATFTTLRLTSTQSSFFRTS